MKGQLVREVEILAEFPNGERFKPTGISIDLGFVIDKYWDDKNKEWSDESRISKIGDVALIMIENGKESYIKFK